MKVFVNSKNEIKDVNTTTEETLVVVEVPDDVFAGWSVAKICCFKLILEDGQYRGFTPYVDSKLIEHIERLGTASDTQKVEMLDLFENQADILYELSLLEIELM